MSAGRVGRSILVTGCSSGIGAYCARALRNEGWNVHATARDDADIEALRADGLAAYRLDYAIPETIREALDAVLEATGGRLDALFNNGAYSQPGAVEDLPVDALRAQFEANLFGWADLTNRVVPVMRAAERTRWGRGRIVHCSSILGLVPMRWRGAYNASKFALEGLMLTQRMEVADAGIHVSMIEPGPVRTRIALNALPHALEHIDVEGSVHREAYGPALERLREGGTLANPRADGPEVVYRALRHALNARRPRARYLVTRQARVAAQVWRVLPTRWALSLASRF